MTEGVEAAARAALDRRLDRTSQAPLAVAVSGGGDSVALLHLAAAWAAEAGRPLRVLTVDHGLNAASGDWAQGVAAAADRLGLPAEILRWEAQKPLTGLPAAARRARHALLAEAARRAGARVILMGHTADDLAEGQAMRAEGSSVGDPQEWSPSPAWPEGRGVFLLRPLLGVSRDNLRVCLRARGEAWLEDPANSDLRFARARARLSAPSQGFLSARSRATPHPSAPRTPSPARGEGTWWGGLLLRRAEIADRRLLSAAVLSASGGAAPPVSRRLVALGERLAAGAPTGTLCGARVVSEGEILLIGRDPGRAGLPEVPAEPGRELAWDGRFEIAPDEAGTVGPLAGRASRLSKAERASLSSAPLWARPTLPVLTTASGAVRLPPEARPLALERLRAACGVYTREADLPPGPVRHGAARAGELSS